jgi:hypothetical protein
MKKLVLSASSLFILATQVIAQEPSINVNTSYKTTESTSIKSKTKDNSSTYSYTVSDVKNGVNVKYGDKTQEVQDDSPSRAKTFTKSFSIDRSDKINLNNQFGSITIKVWNKNEIKVEADIKAYAKTENEAQKLLDDVVVTATKSGDLVTYKTTMGDRNGNWGSNVRNGKTIWRREVKTHYIVYMPASNALTVSQQYGNIMMDDFAGPTSIKVQYGNLTAGNLSNANNYISTQYGKASVKDMGGAKIKHQYGGGTTLGAVDNLDLDAQYTSVSVASVKGAATIKHQYGGGTTIGTVSGAMNVNTQYAPIKISNLRGNLTSRAQYGKVLIDNIEAGNDVDVDAQYSTVSLGFASNYAADFNVRTHYGSFKYGANVSARREGGDDRSYSSSKSYTGQIGKGGNARVKITAQYNTVTFK